jgi:ribosome-binding factor A
MADLLRKKISDPRLELVTVSEVKLTKDLRDAYVYFSVSGGEKARKDAEEGFKSASGFLRKELAGRLGLRFMPKLKFFYDESFDYGSHIDSILNTLKDTDR